MRQSHESNHPKKSGAPVSATPVFLVDGIEAKKPRYVVWNGGKWCYQPTDKMKPHGFGFKPLKIDGADCGAEGVNAAIVTEIEGWNSEWDSIMAGIKPVGRQKHATGTVGWAFRQIMENRELDRQSNGIFHYRDPLMRAWKYIGPAFEHREPKTVTVAELIAFKTQLERSNGASLRYTVMSAWWSLHSQMAGMGLVPPRGYKAKLPIKNKAPKSRDQIWLPEEIEILIKVAFDLGYPALACIISLIWDSSMAPCDACAVTPGQLRVHEPTGIRLFVTKRKKTDKPVIGTMSMETETMIARYIGMRGGVDHDDLIFLAPANNARSPENRMSRMREGVPYSDLTNPGKEPYKLSQNFAKVRLAVFGPEENRILYDLRRSGLLEADQGGAELRDVGAKAANSLATNKQIRGVYLPPQIRAQIESVIASDGHRKTGRENLRLALSEVAPRGVKLLRRADGG